MSKIRSHVSLKSSVKSFTIWNWDEKANIKYIYYWLVIESFEIVKSTSKAGHKDAFRSISLLYITLYGIFDIQLDIKHIINLIFPAFPK